LLTGDITDAGTRAEWAEFIDLLRGYPELRARLSFVPGNHDMNIVDRTNPGTLDLPWSTGQLLRKLRVVLALDAVQGDRSHVVDHASGALGPSLKDYLRERGRVELLRRWRNAALRGRWEIAKIWDAIFPLVELAPADDGYGLILLNSNAPSHFLLTNAIGIVNRSQLNALKSILRNSPRRAWMILLHHQVVEYRWLRSVSATASVSHSSMLRTFWRRSRPMPPVSSFSTAIGIRIGSGPAAMSFCAPRRRCLWAPPMERKSIVEVFTSTKSRPVLTAAFG
jgi:hypothetical protein